LVESKEVKERLRTLKTVAQLFICISYINCRHSLLLYDEKKAIIFGGWDAPICSDDVYLLDLGKIYAIYCIYSIDINNLESLKSSILN
jgi:hypothetical protein